MDNNFEKGEIVRFISAKLPPIHYAVCIGDGYIVHYNNTSNNSKLNKVKIIKEKLKDYTTRSNIKIIHVHV